MSEHENSLFDIMFEQAVIKNIDDELAAIPTRAELEKMYILSDRHKARMKKLFARDKRHDIWKIACVWGRRAAACISITVAVTSAVLMTNPKVFAAVQGTVVEWFDQFTKYGVGTKQLPTEVSVADSEWYPTYLPDGYSKSASSIDGNIATVIYKNEESGVITLIYTSVGGVVSVNNEGIIYGEKIIDGVAYGIYAAVEENENNMIVWEKNGIRFQLFSDAPIPKLQKMAQSFVQK